MRLGRAVTVFLLGTLGWAGTAHAATPMASPRMHFLGVGPVILSDGLRFAVQELPDGSVRVRDAVRKRRFTVRPPAECPESAGFGGGAILFDCSPNGGQPPRGVVFDLRTRSYVPLPAPPRSYVSSFTRYTGIGSHWVEIVGSDLHSSFRAYEDWRTGATRGQTFDPRQIEDMDARGLIRTMCRPLRRSYDPDLQPVGPFAVAYDPPYGLSLVHPTAPEYYVALQRCRATHARFVCRECVARLAGGVLSWALPPTVATRAGYDVGAELLAAGRRFRWRMPGRRDPRAVTVSAHIRGRLYVSVFSSNRTAARLYTVRLR